MRCSKRKIITNNTKGLKNSLLVCWSVVVLVDDDLMLERYLRGEGKHISKLTMCDIWEYFVFRFLIFFASKSEQKKSNEAENE